MARDYAKPRNPNAGRNGGGRGGNGGGNRRGGGNGGGGGSGGALPGWVWMIVGLAIGLVVAAFVYIDRPQHKTKLGEAAQADGDLKPLLGEDRDKPAPKAAKPAASDDGKGKTAKPADSVPVPSPDKVPPRYTFYNELPKIEVAIPREYSRPAPAAAPGKPAPAPAKPPPAEVKQALADPGGAYLVQVGAYKSREEADRQRAKLALIGYESRIEQVTLSERDVRFRVRVGPQPNLPAAQDVLARLESNSISGFLVKIKD